jgi:hypothetical protein
LLINPYTPGAGKVPAYLAGRKNTIDNAKEDLEYLLNGYTRQSKIYYGLRGVGKTVLLNAIENIAESCDIMYEHIEVSETDNFKKIISVIINKLIKRLSMFESFKAFGRKAVSILKAFNATWSSESKEFSIGFGGDIEAANGTADTGNFQNDITELFLALGALAKNSNKPICIFIDEMQYLKDDEFEGLIAAIHRINQKDMPILFFGAGLPKIAKIAGDVKSYSERLFEFIPIGSLDEHDAMEALTEPAKSKSVIFDDEAIKKIIGITEGYPYFIQEFGRQVWKYIEKSNIDANAVDKTIPEFFHSLDNSFFKVRFDRATPKEKEFMYGMVECGDLPCTLAQVAKNMNSSTNKIGPIRAKLIHKGFIYPTGHGEIDFTVPQFDLFLKRVAI